MQRGESIGGIMKEWIQHKLAELRKWSDEQSARPLRSAQTVPLTFNEIYIDRYPQYRERYLTYEQDIDPMLTGSLAWRLVQNRQYHFAGHKGQIKYIKNIYGIHIGFNDIGV